MTWSLSLDATGPRRRRTVYLKEQSGGTEQLRRFQVSSQRASSAVSSGVQLSLCGGCVAGSAAATRMWGGTGARGSEDPAPGGRHSRAKASPARIDPWLAVLPLHRAGRLVVAAPRVGRQPHLSHPRCCRLAGPRGALLWLGVGALPRGPSRLSWRILEAAFLSSSGAAACSALHSRFLHHRSAGLELVGTQGAPPAGGTAKDLHTQLSGAGAKSRLVSDFFCGARVRPGATASSGRAAAGAGPRSQTVLRCISASSNSCQCVWLTWRSGLPLHHMSSKACSH